MDTSNIPHENEFTQGIAKHIVEQIHSGNSPTLKPLLETAINLVMQAERMLHTQDNPNDKANGYYDRELGTPLGRLALQVPRDRDGDFRPNILPPPRQRDCTERYQLLQALLVNSYSPNAIMQSLHDLNMHYNPKQLAELKEHIMKEFSIWQSRELPEDVLGLFIDVYPAQALVDNKVRKVSLYVFIGIDFSGKKSLYGLYLCLGNESKAYWLQTFNQLISRGIKRALYIISDDFPGLKEAVSTLFPKAFHQLCVIHMQRNVHRHMGKEDALQFNHDIKKIRLEQSAEMAEKKFSDLCQGYQNKYPTFIQSLLADKSNYFAFLQLPKRCQKHFYTTNIVESANSMLERIRSRMGGFFQSDNALFTNAFITFRGIEEKSWCKGVPMVKKELYEINQLFARIYGQLPNCAPDG